jgi:hypothetical protein
MQSGKTEPDLAEQIMLIALVTAKQERGHSKIYSKIQTLLQV